MTDAMVDAVLIAVSLAWFALAAGYARALDRM